MDGGSVWHPVAEVDSGRTAVLTAEHVCVLCKFNKNPYTSKSSIQFTQRARAAVSGRRLVPGLVSDVDFAF